MLRPPRRLRPTRAGVVTLVAPFFLGVAAISATNNLLFMLLGVSLGLIVLSGIFSELNLMGVKVRIEPSGEVRAGEPTRLLVSFEREKMQSLPAFGLRLRSSKARQEVIDVTLPELEGSTGTAVTKLTFPKRGRENVEGFELLTDFPFGLFNKIRDVEVSSTVLVWPRRVKVPNALADPRGIAAEGKATGARGIGNDVYGLRERMEWDPIHRIHALRSLATGRDVVVETETTTRPVAWLGIANDEFADPEGLEKTIELAAATIEAWDSLGFAVGVVTFDRIEMPGATSVGDILDVLALMGPSPAKHDLAAPVWLVPAGVAFRPEGAVVFEVAQSGELRMTTKELS